MTTRLLIEGRPGAGKATAAQRLVGILRGRGVLVRGFTTGEIREAGRRVGFRVTAVSGQRAVLAHVNLAGPPRVGRYGVDLTAFEQVALPALGDPGTGGRGGDRRAREDGTRLGGVPRRGAAPARHRLVPGRPPCTPTAIRSPTPSSAASRWPGWTPATGTSSRGNSRTVLLPDHRATG